MDDIVLPLNIEGPFDSLFDISGTQERPFW